MPTLFNKLVFSMLILLGTGACVSSAPPPRPLDLPFSQVYMASYDEVWQAAISVVERYTIVEANREAGILRTNWSSGWHNTDLYAHPDQDDRLAQIRFRITIKLSRGLVSQTGRNATRVQVNKELERYGNIVTGWERIPTDEIEEQILLYRIRQRLRIRQFIERARQRQQQQRDAQ